MRMKNTALRRMCAGLLLCAIALGCSGAAGAAVETQTSEAAVSFTDGTLQFGPLVGSKLNFDFGTNVLPYAKIAYSSRNAEDYHFLQVVDSRYQSGNWTVTTTLTPFQNSATADTFDAVIQMLAPNISATNPASDTKQVKGKFSTEVPSGGTVDMLVASSSLTRDAYTAKWAKGLVKLNIADAAILDISPGTYTATLTWDLNLGP